VTVRAARHSATQPVLQPPALNADNAAMEAEPNKAEPPKRKRRWFQFSLRTLLIFTAVAAVACSWLVSKIERKRQEREAAEAIVKLGGFAYYDCEWTTQGLNFHNRPRGPAWLRKLLGENLFSEFELVSLDKVPGAEAALANIRGLTHVKFLTLSRTNITDADLANLGELIDLQSLDLVETKVTDMGLVNLRGFTQLNSLELSRTKVTDAGLKHLKGLTKLQTLYLDGTKVTDAGVKELKEALPNCYVFRR
jgi:Leucine-rich repeat (LRR) protein